MPLGKPNSQNKRKENNATTIWPTVYPNFQSFWFCILPKSANLMLVVMVSLISFISWDNIHEVASNKCLKFLLLIGLAGAQDNESLWGSFFCQLTSLYILSFRGWYSSFISIFVVIVFPQISIVTNATWNIFIYWTSITHNYQGLL